MLWPGVAIGAGRHRLRQTLSSLRSVLEPPQREGFEVFEVDRHAIRLRAGAISCDALRFAQTCQRGWHPLARELNAGELLPGHCDDWVLDESLRLEVMAERLPAAPQGGTPPAATASALTPAPATSADAPAPAPLAATASVLPHYLSRLVGADRQASRLHAEVLHHRLVKVLGPGGIGKTRLAVEVAQALSRSAGQLLWASSASGLPPGGEAFDLCHRFPHSRCKLKSSAASKPSSPSPTVSKSA